MKDAKKLPRREDTKKSPRPEERVKTPKPEDRRKKSVSPAPDRSARKEKDRKDDDKKNLGGPKKTNLIQKMRLQ